MHPPSRPCSLRAPLWLALFSAACLPSGPVEGEGERSPPTLTHGETEDSTLSAVFAAIVGQALADVSRFEGTESLEITDGDGQVRCRWTWETHILTPDDGALNPETPCALEDGSACQFAHAVALAGGHEDTPDTGSDVDCDPYRSEHPMQEDGGTIGYGYAESLEGDLLMVFADNPAPEADRWIAVPGVSSYAEGVLEYRMARGGLDR